MKKTWWASRDWNALCDECGFKFKSSQLKKRWDGLMVCQECYEIRHPQELIRPIPDQSKLPWTRPEGTDQYVQVSTLSTGCSVLNSQAVAGVGVAGCMVAGRDLGVRSTLSTVEGFH